MAFSERDGVTNKLNTVHLLSREMAQCAVPEEAVGMTAETLAVLFEASCVLICLEWPGALGQVRSALGFAPGQVEQIERALPEILKDCTAGVRMLSSDLVARALPQNLQGPLCWAPLLDGEKQVGFALLCDADLPQDDLVLYDMVLDRLTMHLKLLQSAECHRYETELSAKLVDIVQTLSLAESTTELYRQVLTLSAELVGAERGSLMLLDQASASLSIAVSRGMSRPVAKSVHVPVGQGIAGRVIQRGEALLVNDIEKDERVSASNRPRFKTKSFLCLPLKNRDEFIGVLNLADKEDRSGFTFAELEQLQLLTGHVARLIERTVTVEQAGHMEKLSITDPLTGLYNRRLLECRLDEEISRSQRQGQRFSVILADLDHFKIYNDVLGHLAGDEALKNVARLMRRAAREMDVVTRYGGEEFCLILPGASKQESLFVAERLRRTVEGAVFAGEGHLPQGRLTISLGVSAFPEDGATPEVLLHAADLALYRAKFNGRNRLVLYQADLSETLVSPEAV